MFRATPEIDNGVVMTDFQMAVLICGVIIVATTITISTIYERRKIIKKYGSIEEMKRALADEVLERESMRETISARVLDMNCYLHSVGYKPPKTVRNFEIVFEVEGREPLTLPVPEEYYDGFEISMAGKLTLVDGEFYSFELDNK